MHDQDQPFGLLLGSEQCITHWQNAQPQQGGTCERAQLLCKKGLALAPQWRYLA